MDTVPVIKPIKTKEYHVPESRYKQAGKLPFRSIILGSSGSGKTILLQNMIIDIYKNWFWTNIFIFTKHWCWLPDVVACQKYIENDLKLKETEDEQFYFSEYNSDALSNIIETQKKHRISKNKNYKKYGK